MREGICLYDFYYNEYEDLYNTCNNKIISNDFAQLEASCRAHRFLAYVPYKLPRSLVASAAQANAYDDVIGVNADVVYGNGSVLLLAQSRSEDTVERDFHRSVPVDVDEDIFVLQLGDPQQEKRQLRAIQELVNKRLQQRELVEAIELLKRTHRTLQYFTCTNGDAIKNSKFKRRPLQIARVLYNLGSVQLMGGYFGPAVANLEEAISLYRSSRKKTHPFIVACLVKSGLGLFAMGNLHQALSNFCRAASMHAKMMEQKKHSTNKVFVTSASSPSSASSSFAAIMNSKIVNNIACTLHCMSHDINLNNINNNNSSAALKAFQKAASPFAFLFATTSTKTNTKKKNHSYHQQRQQAALLSDSATILDVAIIEHNVGYWYLDQTNRVSHDKKYVSLATANILRAIQLQSASTCGGVSSSSSTHPVQIMQSSHPVCVCTRENLDYAKWLRGSASQRRRVQEDGTTIAVQDPKSKPLSLSWSTDPYVDKGGGNQQSRLSMSVDEHDDHQSGLNIMRYNSWV